MGKKSIMLTQQQRFSEYLGMPENKQASSWESIKQRIQEGVLFTQPIELHLIRHAESSINAKKLVTGSQDVELTKSGEEQAKNLGERLSKEYDLAFVSGLKRSQKTLEIAISNGEIKVKNIYQDKRLNERSLGVLEGRNYRWIPEYARGELSYAPQGGENYESVTCRILSFLIDLAEYSYSHSVRRVLISSHMGPMRIMVGILTEETNPVTVLKMKFSNTEVIKMSYDHLELPRFMRIH